MFEAFLPACLSTSACLLIHLSHLRVVSGGNLSYAQIVHETKGESLKIEHLQESCIQKCNDMFKAPIGVDL